MTWPEKKTEHTSAFASNNAQIFVLNWESPWPIKGCRHVNSVDAEQLREKKSVQPTISIRHGFRADLPNKSKYAAAA
jgi:hypothetical protein